MIRSRECPRPRPATARSTYRPVASGPRCLRVSVIAARTARDAGTPSKLRTPQMPHIVGTRNAAWTAAGRSSVASRTRVLEKPRRHAHDDHPVGHVVHDGGTRTDHCALADPGALTYRR